MTNNLNQLKESIISIVARVDYSLEVLFFSCEMNTATHDLKSKIKDTENLINEECDEALKLCIYLLESLSPKGKELRFVISSMRMIRELERIGDHIVHISRGLQKLPPKELLMIMEMLREISIMNRTVIDAYVLERLDLAEDAIKNDKVINDFNRRVIKSFLKKTADIENIKQGYQSTKVAKSIERIGDYIKNIAEEVIFIEKGFSINAIAIQGEDDAEKAHPIS